MWTPVKSLTLKRQLYIFSLALFWISLISFAEALPGRPSRLRSVYFRPYRYPPTVSWDSFPKEPDYEYEEEEFIHIPEHRPTERYPEPEPYPKPEPMNFGGTFQISKNHFETFDASDVMVGRPQPSNTFQPHGYPPPVKSVSSVHSTKYEPTSDENLSDNRDVFRPSIPDRPIKLYDAPNSRVYLTPPSVYYQPTDSSTYPSSSLSPTYLPPNYDPESDFLEISQREKKQDKNFRNLTNTNVMFENDYVNSRPSSDVNGPSVQGNDVPQLDSVPVRDNHNPSILSTLNKLTATTTSSPHQDPNFSRFDNATSHHFHGDLEPDTSPFIPKLNDSGSNEIIPHLPSAIQFPNSSHHESSLSSISQSSSNTSVITVAVDTTQNSTIVPSEIDSKGWRLSTGAIAGIVIGILAPLSLVAGALVYLMYGRHFKNIGNGESRGTTDNCAYIDDSVRPSGYMNSHIELPKENSEEMTSLDNDSFLNSLEAVTIQNYWAESAKNTKV